MEPTTPNTPAPRPGRLRLPRRRGAIVLALALSVSMAVAAVATTARLHSDATNSGAGRSTPARLTSGGGTTTTTVPLNPPPHCPGATNPPGAPYQVAVTASLTAKLRITGIAGLAPGTAASGNHIASDLCGLLLLPGETSIVLPQNTTFANPTLITVPLTGPPYVQDDEVDLSLAAPTLASVAATPAADGGLNLTIKAVVETIVYLGVPSPVTPHCADGPVTVTLTTAAPGGQALTGPLQSATATLVASGFTIPPIHDTSAPCGGQGMIYGQLIDSELNLLPSGNDHTSMTAIVHLSVSD
jgi:hypothetical protein